MLSKLYLFNFLYVSTIGPWGFDITHQVAHNTNIVTVLA